MKRNQSGFTLIEIAIVLVIIGLLLGGVLKGQELINSAKVKNLATDFKNIPVYIYGYQDKYRALPGDDLNVVTHIGAAATLATLPATKQGNGVIDGKWDALAGNVETQLFWQHVRLANLATGTTTAGADYLPTNSVGGVIGITNGGATDNPDTSATPISGTYIICSGGILGKYAYQLDLQMDDGTPTGGSMRAYTSSNTRPSTLTVPTNGSGLTGGRLNDADSYTVCMGV
jgi:prepilin-type N-terminal cleavage/methylation domain-containing protein